MNKLIMQSLLQTSRFLDLLWLAVLQAKFGHGTFMGLLLELSNKSVSSALHC